MLEHLIWVLKRKMITIMKPARSGQAKGDSNKELLWWWNLKIIG